MNRVTSLVDLYRAIGGGWIERTATSRARPTFPRHASGADVSDGRSELEAIARVNSKPNFPGPDLIKKSALRVNI